MPRWRGEENNGLQPLWFQPRNHCSNVGYRTWRGRTEFYLQAKDELSRINNTGALTERPYKHEQKSPLYINTTQGCLATSSLLTLHRSIGLFLQHGKPFWTLTWRSSFLLPFSICITFQPLK